MNHITSNYFFEQVLESLLLLPENYYLATLGKITPASYFSEIQMLVKKMKLDKRVIFFDPVPYNQLSSYASGADVGLIVRDIRIPNNHVSLPNRLFDYIAAKVPICSSPIPHIEKIIRQYNIGEIFINNEPLHIAETILSAIEKSDIFRKGIEKAALELTWEKKEKQFLNFLNSPETVTILGIKNLTKNNRAKRMAMTLALNGTKVNIVTTQPFNGVLHPNISWHYINI
jgi:glycosyltransferase involved in cell wall biosynthesis